jgi:hypothetical protein
MWIYFETNNSDKIWKIGNSKNQDLILKPGVTLW